MVTITQLQAYFNIFNKKYFGDSLPIADIKYCNSKSYVGIFNPRKNKNGRYTIKISRYYELPIIEVENTLIHEMIHLWQWVNKYYDVHGASFIKKMNEINKFGNHNISVVADFTANRPKISEKNIKTSTILIFEDNLGEVICKVNNQCRLKQLYKIMKKTPGYNNLRCFSIKNDVIESMVDSRKKIHYYRLPELFRENVKKDLTNEIFINI